MYKGNEGWDLMKGGFNGLNKIGFRCLLYMKIWTEFKACFSLLI